MPNVGPLPKTFVEDDLLKPLFGAAWTGLVLSLFDGWPKSKKLQAFTFLVIFGTIWLTLKRHKEDDSE